MKMNDLSKNFLYHGTSVAIALKILEQNLIEARTVHKIEDKRVEGVSATRSYKMAEEWSECVIILDRDKIKNHNKIIPVDFLHTNPHFNVKRRDNAEDFIVGEVKAPTRKVEKVDINFKGQRSPYFEDLLDKLTELSIPYEILQK